MLERPKFLSFAQHGDDRGHLVVIEGGTDIPFQIKRTFYMYDFTQDSVLLVLSSEHYDAKEYIRDYSEWCEEVGLSGASV